MGESQGEQKAHFGVTEGVRAGAWEGKNQFHTEKQRIQRRRRESKENSPRRGRRKHERISGHKNSPEVSGQSWIYSKSWRNLI